MEGAHKWCSKRRSSFCLGKTIHLRAESFTSCTTATAKTAHVELPTDLKVFNSAIPFQDTFSEVITSKWEITRRNLEIASFASEKTTTGSARAANWSWGLSGTMSDPRFISPSWWRDLLRPGQFRHNSLYLSAVLCKNTAQYLHNVDFQ